MKFLHHDMGIEDLPELITTTTPTTTLKGRSIINGVLVIMKATY